MKTLLIEMMVALLLVGCGGGDSQGNVNMEGTAPNEDALETAVDWSKLQDRNGVTYLPNTDKPFSGHAKRVYDNEQVEVLAQFKDGFVVRLKQWQENGTPRWDIGYMQGKVGGQDVPLDDFRLSNSSCNHGLWTIWYENGQKRWENHYKDGEKDGLQTWWYENGQKRREENWKAGKRDGLTTWWYENGQKKSEEIIKDDKRISAGVWKPNGEKCPATNLKDGNGVVVLYYQKGQKRLEGHYKEREKDGLNTWWYENGQKEVEGNYKDGKEDGLQTGWYENGQMRWEANYKDGKMISGEVWKPNGEKCPVTNIDKDGNGVMVFYNEDETEGSRTTYRDGEPVEE